MILFYFDIGQLVKSSDQLSRIEKVAFCTHFWPQLNGKSELALKSGAKSN